MLSVSNIGSAPLARLPIPAAASPAPVVLATAGTGGPSGARRPAEAVTLAPGLSGRLAEGAGKKKATDSFQLSDEEQQQVDKLAARDREVRAHERAHAAVGGQFAGQPSFGFEKGPDGRQYAVEGEVPIDASPVPGDPKATIAKMQVVKAAALAPAKPSGQDRSVAAQADAQAAKARAELNAGGGKDDPTDPVKSADTSSAGNGASAAQAIAAYVGTLQRGGGSAPQPGIFA